MKKLKSLLCLTLACACLLSLCACGGSTSTVDDDALIIGVRTDIVSLDPANHSNIITGLVTESIYDTLFIPDANGDPIMSLATSYEYLSDTQLQVTIHEGVQYHDGTTMTSEDIQASLMRAKESAVVANYYTLMDSIDIVDDYTVIFNLSEPYAPFLYCLSHHSAAIMPKAYLDSDPDFSQPIGSGAYKFVSWVTNDSVELEKNPDYFKTDAISEFETVSLRVIPESSSRTIALEAGEINMVYELETLDFDRIDEMDDLQGYMQATNQTIYAYFNTEKAPFDDVTVRQAFNYLVDKESIRDIVYTGTGGIMNSITPSNFMGYNEDVYYDFNPELAKEMLEAAGIEEGHTFSILAASGFVEKIAQIIQSNLYEIGYNAEIDLVDWSVFHEITASGEYEVTIGGITKASDPDNYFGILLHTDAIGAENRARYSDPELDALIDAGRVTTDTAEREEIYAEAYRVAMEGAPWVPLWTGVTALGATSNMDLSECTSCEGSIYFNYIHLS